MGASFMGQRPRTRFRPRIERLEEKQPLSAGPSPAPLANARAGAASRVHAGQADAAGPRAAVPVIRGFTMDRITQPTPQNRVLLPPIKHVLVQGRPPVPGQVYNLLFLTVWNGTKRTFTAADNLFVKISDQGPGHAYPVLTGNEQWQPGQRIAFYLITKKYFPLSPVVSAGFEFNFVNSPRVVAIPGPSGIFLRLRYNPATFDRVFNSIILTGPGARGNQFGLPDTAIWELVPANTGIPL
jgi:hypothetical protein